MCSPISTSTIARPAESNTVERCLPEKSARGPPMANLRVAIGRLNQIQGIHSTQSAAISFECDSEFPNIGKRHINLQKTVTLLSLSVNGFAVNIKLCLSL